MKKLIFSISVIFYCVNIEYFQLIIYNNVIAKMFLSTLFI